MTALIAFAVPVCTLVATLTPALSGKNEHDATGDWAGWVYQDSGGDFPVRLHVDRDGETWTCTYDLPHMRAFRMPLEVSVADGRFRMRATAAPLLGFELALDRSASAGIVTLEGGPLGEIEVDLAPLPLPTVDPESYGELAGAYRFPSGRIVVVDRRSWGELTAFDDASGRHANLFALDERLFFTGSAMYVPGPVTALASFGTDELRWQVHGQAAEIGQRVALERTELGFHSDGAELHGTLVHPRDATNLPAVVVLGGSNWTDRGSLNREGRLWAAAGYAAFLYDKRGYGESGGDAVAPFGLAAADARAAAAMLATRPEVDGSRIGVSGTSRGGWLAQLAATGESPFAFCVTFVGPAVSPAAQETTRRTNAMRRAGFDELAVERARSYLDEAWRFGRTGNDVEAYEAAWRAAKDEPWAELVDVAAPDTDWSWVRLNMHHDPLPALAGLRVPLLAVFGEKDDNVVVAENVPALERALSDVAGHEIVVLPNANHGLRVVDGEGQRPWSHRAAGFAPGLWSLVFDWVDARVGE